MTGPLYAVRYESLRLPVRPADNRMALLPRRSLETEHRPAAGRDRTDLAGEFALTALAAADQSLPVVLAHLDHEVAVLL
jgi:hypothetical protein